ncbi:MAG TPA: hypothetical protein VGL84_04785 [Gaiellaceae bacterium]
MDISQTVAMGFFDFIKRWSKVGDDRALERAEEETRMSTHDREIFEEDYEARKDDAFIEQRDPGSGSFEKNVNNE